MKCVQCGLCKMNCPVYYVLRKEMMGPRGILKLKENSEFGDFYVYACTLCKNCEKECPVEIKISEEIVKAREASVARGFETEANKKMIENIRNYGNPFGDVKKGEIPKELYCC